MMARLAGKKSYYTIGMIGPDGAVVQEYDFPSVTSVLDVIAKPSLMHWYYREGIKGIGELYRRFGAALPSDDESLFSLMKTEKLAPYNKRDTAAKSGTSIHEELEKLCVGGTVKRTDHTAGLLDWWEARGLTPEDILATERPLVSFKHGVAGTVDVVYRDPLDGKIVMGDLKTGKHIAYTMFVQGEAYKMMAAETTDLPSVDIVSVIHCPLEGEWKELQAPEITVETFLSCLQIYRALPVKWHPTEMDERRIV